MSQRAPNMLENPWNPTIEIDYGHKALQLMGHYLGIDIVIFDLDVTPDRQTCPHICRRGKAGGEQVSLTMSQSRWEWYACYHHEVCRPEEGHRIVLPNSKTHRYDQVNRAGWDWRTDHDYYGEVPIRGKAPKDDEDLLRRTKKRRECEKAR